MAAAADHKRERAIDSGAHIVAFDSERRQRRCHVDHGKRLRRKLDGRGCRGNHGGKAFENFQFQRQGALGGIGDLGFEFAELGGGEAHLSGGGLPVDECGVERRRHQFVTVLRRDVDEIAQHIVVPDFQRADAGGLGIFHLERGDDAPRFIAQRPGLVERGVIAGADKAAVAAERRQFIGQRLRKLRGDGGVGLAQACDGIGEVAGRCGEG